MTVRRMRSVAHSDVLGRSYSRRLFLIGIEIRSGLFNRSINYPTTLQVISGLNSSCGNIQRVNEITFENTLPSAVRKMARKVRCIKSSF